MVTRQEALVLHKAWQRLRRIKPTCCGRWIWHGLEARAGGEGQGSVRIVLAVAMLACWLVVSYFENASRANWIAITSLERTKVNGYWTWQAVHAAGGIHTKLPYDCHAGRQNWHIGWSAPKKARRES